MNPARRAVPAAYVLIAVSLVFCLNLIIRLREKYRGNEYKIGAHSLTTPVDHRYSRGGAKLRRVA